MLFAQCAYWTAVPWPPAVASLIRAVDQLGGLGLPAAEAREGDRGERSDAAPGRLLDGIELRHQQRGTRRVAAHRVGLAAHVVRYGEDLERPGVAGEPKRTRADLETAVVVPQEVRRPRRQKAPSEHLVHGDLGARECGDRAPQHGAAARRPSVKISARPSSSRSRGSGGSALGAVAAARETSSRLPPALAIRPANSAAPHASRYVSRERRTSSGSSFRAASSSSSGASPPRFWANATSAWSRSRRARANSSSGPASAAASSPRATSNAPAPRLAWAAARALLGSPGGIARQRDRTP